MGGATVGVAAGRVDRSVASVGEVSVGTAVGVAVAAVVGAPVVGDAGIPVGGDSVGLTSDPQATANTTNAMASGHVRVNAILISLFNLHLQVQILVLRLSHRDPGVTVERHPAAPLAGMAKVYRPAREK